MRQLRSSRALVKLWLRRRRTRIQRAGGADGTAKPAPIASRSAFTASGLAVEAQLHKAFSPRRSGLATF